jgi:hypothetical protein
MKEDMDSRINTKDCLKRIMDLKGKCIQIQMKKSSFSQWIGEMIETIRANRLIVQNKEQNYFLNIAKQYQKSNFNDFAFQCYINHIKKSNRNTTS